MSLNLSYKLYQSSTSFLKQIKQSVLIRYIILTCQTICLLLLMIKSLILNNSIPTLNTFFISLDLYFFNNKQIVDILSTVALILFIVLLLIRIVRVIKYSEGYQDSTNQDKDNKKFSKHILLLQTVIVYSIDILIIPCLWSFAQLYNLYGVVTFLAKSFIPITISLVFSFKFPSARIIRYQLIPTVFSIVLISTPIRFIVIACLSITYLIRYPQVFLKILHGYIIIGSIIVFKYLSFNEPCNIDIIAINIGVILLVASVVIFQKTHQIHNQSMTEPQKALGFFNKLSKMKGTIPYKQLQYKDFLQIYNWLYTFIQQQKSNEKNLKDYQKPQKTTIQQFETKQSQQLTKDEFIGMMQLYMNSQWNHGDENRIHYKIILIKIKIVRNYPMNTIVDETFTLYDQISKDKHHYFQQFFQLYDQIVQKFGLFKHGKLQPTYIFYINKLHETFQHKVQQFLQKMKTFWFYFASENLKKSTLDSTLEQALKQQNELQLIYERMKHFEKFEPDLKLLQQTRNLLNSYQQQSGRLAIKTKDQLSENDNSLCFTVIQAGVIKFMSKDLLRSMCQTSVNYVNNPISVLFGEEFAVVIDQKIAKFTAEVQTEQFSIPIFSLRTFMHLKRAKILWYPSLSVRNRYLIRFFDQLQNDTSLIVFHGRSDSIKYFNLQFLVEFKLQKQKLTYVLKNHQISFKEMFINAQIQDANIQSAFRLDQPIKCSMIATNYIDDAEADNLVVQLKCLKIIQVPYLSEFFVLKTTKYVERQSTTLSANSNSSSVSSLSRIAKSNPTIQTLQKRYADQTFFCPIPNSYENKITQKQAQLQETGRWIYRYFIHLIVALIVFLCIALTIIDNTLISTRITNYETYNKAMQNVAEGYLLLYQCFSLSFKKYYISQFPDSTLTVYNITSDKLIPTLNNIEEDYLSEFLSRYLTQLNNQPNNIVHYSLDFQQFKINTSTDLSNLLDFAQNIKKSIALDTQINFLVNNYDNLRGLSIDYQSSFEYDTLIAQVISTDILIRQISIIIAFTLITFSIIVLIRIQLGIQVIYEIISRISRKQYKNAIKIFLSKNENVKKQFQIINQQNLAYRIKKDQQGQQSKSEVNSVQNSNAQLPLIDQNDEDQQQEIKVPHKMKDQMKEVRKIVQESLVTKLSRKVFLLIFLFFINGILLYDYINLTSEQIGVQKMFDIKKQLFRSIIHVKRQQVDGLFMPIVAYYDNTIQYKKYIVNQISLISQINDNVIFPEMIVFAQEASRMLLGNLCTLGAADLTMNTKPCQTYLDGMLARGLGQSFDIFVKNSKQISQLKLSQFTPTACDINSCPVYYQNQYSSLLIGQSIRKILDSLNSAITLTFNNQKSSVLTRSVVRIFGLLMLGVLYMVNDHFLKKRCHRAIQYFKLIPKNVMSAMNITSFIRKNDILSKLDML